MVILVPLILASKKERNEAFHCEDLRFIYDGHDVSINLTKDSGSSRSLSNSLNYTFFGSLQRPTNQRDHTFSSCFRLCLDVSHLNLSVSRRAIKMKSNDMPVPSNENKHNAGNGRRHQVHLLETSLLSRAFTHEKQVH